MPLKVGRRRREKGKTWAEVRMRIPVELWRRLDALGARTNRSVALICGQMIEQAFTEDAVVDRMFADDVLVRAVRSMFDDPAVFQRLQSAIAEGGKRAR